MFIKKLYITAIAVFSLATATAQQTTASVEKSLFNVQAGAIGIWASHEARLSNKWALRTEIGLDLWSYETYSYNTAGETRKGSVLVPSIAIEPRWYYNIQKRADKGRYTANNSANFLTLAIKYYPDLFVVGGPDNLKVRDQISFIPKWGIRRAIAQSGFNYELGIGVGPVLYLEKNSYYRSISDVALDLHARIGYTFK